MHMYRYFQYTNSIYFMIYKDSCSWSEAEYMCSTQGTGHLWSINSHDEWWDVYHSLASSIINPETQQDLNIDLMNTAFTVILFIGLQYQSPDFTQVLYSNFSITPRSV